jgi:hypothetical protein
MKSGALIILVTLPKSHVDANMGFIKIIGEKLSIQKPDIACQYM